MAMMVIFTVLVVVRDAVAAGVVVLLVFVVVVVFFVLVVDLHFRSTRSSLDDPPLLLHLSLRYTILICTSEGASDSLM